MVLPHNIKNIEKNGGSKEWRLLIICCIYQKNLNWILKKDQIFI